MPHKAPAELARLQRGFLALVTARQTRSREACAALADIEAGDDVTAREQVAVYRDMYGLRMEREVAREFPATRALLGTSVFARLARAFVAAHPSRSFTLEGYAVALPEFLLHAKTIRSSHARSRASEIAALERAIWQRSGVRVRVAAREEALLRALLSGAGLARAISVATRSGLEPDGIRSALEHWVAVGLLELRYPSDPWSIQAARCRTSAPD